MRKFGRALSSGNIVEYAQAQAYSRKNAPDKPIHKMVESLLSTESGFTNFRGLINWGLILLLIFGGKMALNNINSNGIIMDPFLWRYIIQGEHAQPAGLAFIASSNLFILIGFGIEILANLRLIPEPITVLLVSLNLLGSILYPTIVVLAIDWNPVFTSPMLMMYIVIFLKLWSYAMVNRWCRAARRKIEISVANSQQSDANELQKLLTKPDGKLDHKNVRHRRLGSGQNQLDAVDKSRAVSVVTPPTKKNLAGELVVDSVFPGEADPADDASQKFRIQLTSYPNNLTLYDLYYFMFAPTLCYEVNFPRTFSIRKRFLLKRILELICLTQLIMCLVQQWMVPALKSSVTPFIRSRWIYTLERLLNIAIPNHILWLLGFYAMFHSLLNVIAELLRFGDRCFYEDWWNATSVTSFWSSWNIPVHRWCHRHLYKPLLSKGFSRLAAAAVVFFTSAFFHELMVSVPLKMPRMWAFLGMLGQQPYAFLVYKFCKKGGKMGNMAMWLTLIVGQPLALYMYFHDYYVMRYN